MLFTETKRGVKRRKVNQNEDKCRLENHGIFHHPLYFGYCSLPLVRSILSFMGVKAC